MGRVRVQYFGWFKDGAFFLSLYPADAPVRPSLRLESPEELAAFLKRRRAEVFWWPPLPNGVFNAGQSELENAKDTHGNSRLERWR